MTHELIQETVLSKTKNNIMLRIAVAGVIRLFINTSIRFFYPFAPVLSRGLGVPVTAVTNVIAINQVTGLLSPFFGPMADTKGYRPMMFIGLTALFAGMTAAFVFPDYKAVCIAMFIAGLSRSAFNPSILAYIGREVPYVKRAFAIGILETSWAASTLIGIPLIGFVIDKWGWLAPFPVLAFAALLSLYGVYRYIPESIHASSGLNKRSGKSLWLIILKSPPALGGIAFAFFTSAANDCFFVTYGLWMEDTFNLTTLSIGLTTAIIGAAELSGEFMTAGLSDRIGLKKSTFIGGLISAASYLMIPASGNSLTTGLIALFVVFLSLEFTIVSTLSFITEVIPEARATMLSCFYAAASLGRVVGAVTGGVLYQKGGEWIVCPAAFAAGIIALMVFFAGIRKKI